jgi:hypothetical protein
MSTPVIRRRSQRLFLQVPVIVKGQLPNKSEFSEATKTIVLNAHGALVELAATVETGQIVILQNARTNQEEESIVKLVSAGRPGKFNVALEFKSPSPNFWQITFPPDDWAVRSAEPKKTLK